MSNLTFQRTFLFWLPLALSMLMMVLAGPIVSAGLARAADPEISIAAYGVALNLAVIIESPMIMLLHTSIVLSRDRPSYLLIRRFMLHLGLITTVISLLVYFTPLYDILVIGLLGIPENVARTALLGLRVMILWPTAIGWRRFYQGVLIHDGHTRTVGFGTACRLATLILIIYLGAALTDLSGIVIGGLALVSSVIVEAIYVTWQALPIAMQLPQEAAEDDTGEPLTYSSLVGFHFPLAVTSLLIIASRPTISAGLARSALPTLSLAAWPVALGAVNMVTAGLRAMQETTVALVENRETLQRVRRFVWTMALAMTAFLTLVSFSPIITFYLRRLIGISSTLEQMAIRAVRIMIVMPLLMGLQSYLRGILVKRGYTSGVRRAMVINWVSLSLILLLGIRLGSIEGVVLGASAVVVSSLIEVLVLYQQSLRAVEEVEGGSRMVGVSAEGHAAR